MITLPEFESGKGPVLMLNLLKFKDKVHYFEQYLPAFKKAVAQLGIEGVKVILVSEVVATIIAPANEVWDMIVLVEYPDATVFKVIAESEAYHTIAEPYRLAALTDLKLFMTRRSEM